ncbi:hypothetical protein BP6252_06656 [Coleophoma cylindrospora]|uniref:Major facilitator superfamily (MFS) profile domain-containing protein n=1 Tax=Coleophoma cylindrospora TaxID=1849047 RepID=A0A3D8RNN9_9HELO|nr:hypothetical protein BP6252_06656 [Coleophoma cylindrospora]
MATSEKLPIEAPSASAADSVKEKNEHLEGIKLFAIVGCLTFAGFLLMLDESVISTAIPKITTDFHSLNDVGWYGTSYLLTNCALQPLSGKIYGQFNIKWTFLAFFFIFELGSALSGAAQSSNMLITGRAVAGIGGSGLLNGAYGIIHRIAPLEKQPLLLGIVIGISLLGILSGPLIGGLLTEFVSWRWCFYINLPCGAVAAALILLISIPGNKGTADLSVTQKIRKLDLIGFFFFAPAIMMLIFALEWGGIMYAWNSSRIIGLFCGSGVTLMVFVAWEHRMAADAMIPLSIIGRRVIWSSCLYMFFFIGSALTAIYYLPLYFQAVRNASPTMSGVDLLPSILATAIFSIVTGGLVERVGYYLPFAILGSILATLGQGLSSTFDPKTSIGIWIGYQIIMSAGRGMGFQMPIVAVQNHSTKEEISVVNALVVFAQYLGGAVFLSLDEIIFSSSLRHYIKIYAPEIDPQVIIDAGASGIRKAVPAASLSGVVLAYSKSVDRALYLGTGAAGIGLLFCFGMGWTNIKTKAEAEKLEKLAKADKEKTEKSEKFERFDSLEKPVDGSQTAGNSST